MVSKDAKGLVGHRIMSEHFVKYPRTPHVSWSLGRTDDDKVIESLDTLKSAARIIVTEKIDGENTTFYKDGIHARSINNTNHPSRSWVKRWHGGFSYQLPSNLRFCGENMYAYHSIRYFDKSLQECYFLLFNIWNNDTNECLSWDETIVLAKQYSIPTVPVLYDGIWDEQKIRTCFTGDSQFKGQQEGYVVRIADSFTYDQFPLAVAKFVRENHVQTDEHWMERYGEPPNGTDWDTYLDWYNVRRNKDE